MAAMTLGFFSAPATADTYPNRPINFVVPFPTGGGNDLLAREIGAVLSQRLGQPVVVENKPGAGSAIGTQYVARAKPDGYTLLMVANTAVINSAYTPTVPYDIVKDFAGVALVAKIPLALVTSNSIPKGSVKDFIDYLKASPGKYNYGSSGQGTVQHMAGLMFMSMTETDMVHIPFKGNAQIVSEMIPGRVEVLLGPINSLLGPIRSGQLRALAVGGLERSAILPDLPTLNEAGVEGFDLDVWYGIALPAGAPPEVIQKLNDEIRHVMSDPALQEKLAGHGMETLTVGAPKEMDDLVRQDLKTWTEILEKEQIKKQ
jgi:tripartite-type tricarboxylate transporter receptor subunit TctC